MPLCVCGEVLPVVLMHTLVQHEDTLVQGEHVRASPLQHRHLGAIFVKIFSYVMAAVAGTNDYDPLAFDVRL